MPATVLHLSHSHKVGPNARKPSVSELTISHEDAQNILGDTDFLQEYRPLLDLFTPELDAINTHSAFIDELRTTLCSTPTDSYTNNALLTYFLLFYYRQQIKSAWDKWETKQQRSYLANDYIPSPYKEKLYDWQFRFFSLFDHCIAIKHLPNVQATAFITETSRAQRIVYGGASFLSTSYIDYHARQWLQDASLPDEQQEFVEQLIDASTLDFRLRQILCKISEFQNYLRSQAGSYSFTSVSSQLCPLTESSNSLAEITQNKGIRAWTLGYRLLPELLQGDTTHLSAFETLLPQLEPNQYLSLDAFHVPSKRFILHLLLRRLDPINLLLLLGSPELVQKYATQQQLQSLVTSGILNIVYSEEETQNPIFWAMLEKRLPGICLALFQAYEQPKSMRSDTFIYLKAPNALSSLLNHDTTTPPEELTPKIHCWGNGDKKTFISSARLRKAIQYLSENDTSGKFKTLFGHLLPDFDYTLFANLPTATITKFHFILRTLLSIKEFITALGVKDKAAKHFIVLHREVEKPWDKRIITVSGRICLADLDGAIVQAGLNATALRHILSFQRLNEVSNFAEFSAVSLYSRVYARSRLINFRIGSSDEHPYQTLKLQPPKTPEQQQRFACIKTHLCLFSYFHLLVETLWRHSSNDKTFLEAMTFFRHLLHAFSQGVFDQATLDQVFNLPVRFSNDKHPLYQQARLLKNQFTQAINHSEQQRILRLRLHELVLLSCDPTTLSLFWDGITHHTLYLINNLRYKRHFSKVPHPPGLTTTNTYDLNTLHGDNIFSIGASELKTQLTQLQQCTHSFSAQAAISDVADNLSTASTEQLLTLFSCLELHQQINGSQLEQIRIVFPRGADEYITKTIFLPRPPRWLNTLSEQELAAFVQKLQPTHLATTFENAAKTLAGMQPETSSARSTKETAPMPKKGLLKGWKFLIGASSTTRPSSAQQQTTIATQEQSSDNLFTL